MSLQCVTIPCIDVDSTLDLVVKVISLSLLSFS